MTYSTLQLWTIIGGVALGTYLLRFSFLGLVGDRKLPKWAERHLRYVVVAVMPGLIAAAVLWPEATNGQTDPARLLAAFATCAVGIWKRDIIWSVAAGMGTLYAMLWIL